MDRSPAKNIKDDCKPLCHLNHSNISSTLRKSINTHHVLPNIGHASATRWIDTRIALRVDELLRFQIICSSVICILLLRFDRLVDDNDNEDDSSLKRIPSRMRSVVTRATKSLLPRMRIDRDLLENISLSTNTFRLLFLARHTRLNAA